MSKEIAICKRCNRKLKDSVSISREYGPVCYKKHLKEKDDQEFQERQTNIYDFLEDEKHEDERKAI